MGTFITPAFQPGSPRAIKPHSPWVLADRRELAKQLVLVSHCSPPEQLIAGYIEVEQPRRRLLRVVKDFDRH